MVVAEVLEIVYTIHITHTHTVTQYTLRMHAGAALKKNMNKIAEKMNSVELDIVLFFTTFLFYYCFCFKCFFFFCVELWLSLFIVAKTLIISNVLHFHCGIARHPRKSYAFYGHFFLFVCSMFSFSEHQSCDDNIF